MLRFVSSTLVLLCIAVACGESEPLPLPGGGSGGAGGTGGSGATGGTGGMGGSGGSAGAGVCGDGDLQGSEACDEGENNSDNRPDACRSDCTLARCGDGTIDTDEACDDGNTASLDGCDELCQIEPHCGDGIRNNDEACDGEDIPTDCSALGFVTGTVSCTEACTIDDSACRPAEDCTTIGDEDGDGDADCADSDCDGHFECPDCGDGTMQRGETCEGSVPNDQSCADQGFNSGALACVACQIDASGCFNVEICDVQGDEDGDGDADCDDLDCAGHFECPACGDDIIQRGERCDGSVPPGSTCGDFNFNSGVLACTSCQVDPVGCYNVELCSVAGDEDGDGDADCNDTDCTGNPPCIPGCGNGTIENAESCDDGNTTSGDGCSDACVIEGTPLPFFVGDFVQFTGSLDFPDPQHAYRPNTWCTLNGFGPQYYDLHYVTNTGTNQLHLQIDASWTGNDGALAVTEAPYDPADPVARCIDFDDDENDDDISTIRYLIVEPGQTVGIVATTYFVNQSISAYTVTVTAMGVCGDAMTSFPETCDDGNMIDGDGCNSDCGIPPVIADVEPNETTSSATPLPAGSIGVGTLDASAYWMPADAVDVWQVDLAAGTSYVLRAAGTLTGGCGVFDLYQDTMLELLDAGGTVLATSTNISGTELCSTINHSAATTGIHYLRVTQENFLSLPDPLPVRYFLSVEAL